MESGTLERERGEKGGTGVDQRGNEVGGILHENDADVYVHRAASVMPVDFCQPNSTAELWQCAWFFPLPFPPPYGTDMCRSRSIAPKEMNAADCESRELSKHKCHINDIITQLTVEFPASTRLQ